MTEYCLDFPRAYGPVNATAIFRERPEDFIVDEELGFAPGGTGEHVFIQLCKRGENTAWVAEKIAELAKVGINDVGYAGRKDRHAVTTQWFSVYLPKAPEPDWALLNSSSVQVLSWARHHQKLRKGDHQLNHFTIRLREFCVGDLLAFEQKLELVLAQGVPNYFGEQRFGFDGNNLVEADAILVAGKRYKDKQKRGLMLSAGRSYLFNQVLAARVMADTWTLSMPGETQEVASGPLWGRGRSLVSDDLLAFEQNVLANWQAWCNGLEHAGLSQERRSLVLQPLNPRWRWVDKDLELAFSLSAGEFATAVLRELTQLHNSQAVPV